MNELEVSPHLVGQAQVGLGAACPVLSQTSACSGTDCVVSVWSSWLPVGTSPTDNFAQYYGCPQSVRTRTRTRAVTVPANGGVACPALSETLLCLPHVSPGSFRGTVS